MEGYKILIPTHIPLIEYLINSGIRVNNGGEVYFKIPHWFKMENNNLFLCEEKDLPKEYQENKPTEDEVQEKVWDIIGGSYDDGYLGGSDEMIAYIMSIIKTNKTI